MPGLPRASRARCPWRTSGRSSGRSSSASRSAARSPSAPSSTARTTSIPTFRRATRSPSTTSRSAPAAGSSCPAADGDREIGIVRAHLEEDAAKTIHVGGAGGRIARRRVLARRLQPRRHAARRDRHASRTSAPPEEARRFLQLLRQTVVELGISDAEMEKGSLRCDANVSVRQAGETGFRTKTELKNMNSFKFVADGIEAEVARQIAIYEAGGEVVQETLHFDPATRLDRAAPLEGGGGRLPLLPGARPRAGRAVRRDGRAAARRDRRAPGGAHPPARGGGRLRPRRGARHERPRPALRARRRATGARSRTSS